MDIIGGKMSLASDGKTLITTLMLKNLSKSTASPGGQGNDYFFVWNYKGTQYFSHASVDSGGAVTYTDGKIVGGTMTDRSGASDAGSFNAGPNGTIVVRVPLSAVGGPKRGQILRGPTAETEEQAGLLLETVDTTYSQHDYMIGQGCKR